MCPSLISIVSTKEISSNSYKFLRSFQPDFNKQFYHLNIYKARRYTEGAKSHSSVTEGPIEIILSGMTYYHHWFEEFVLSKHICVHFFQMKGLFSHLFDSLDSRIESSFIGLCLAIRITFY